MENIFENKKTFYKFANIVDVSNIHEYKVDNFNYLKKLSFKNFRLKLIIHSTWEITYLYTINIGKYSLSEECFIKYDVLKGSENDKQVGIPIDFINKRKDFIEKWDKFLSENKLNKNIKNDKKKN
jgi:hypothetical protein